MISPEEAKRRLDEAGVTKQDQADMMKYAWVVAKVVKMGYDGLSQLVYREEWREGNGLPWDGFGNRKMYEDLMTVLRMRAIVEVYDKKGMARPPTLNAIPDAILPEPTKADFADVLEQQADTLDLRVLELAYAGMPPHLRGAAAFGKTMLEMYIGRNKALRDQLTFEPEKVCLDCLAAASLMPKYRQELLPVYQMMYTHPRLLAWIGRFIRRFFKLEGFYLKAMQEQQKSLKY